MAYRIQSDQSKALTSFADKMAWIKEAQARYEAYDAAVQDAQDKAAALSSLQYADNAEDRNLYNQVQAYNQAASDMAATLSSTGQIDRNALSALRASYRTKVKPIEDAMAIRNKWAEKAASDPDAIHTEIGSVDSYMKNPTQGYKSIKNSDLDKAATQYGTMLMAQSKPEEAGTNETGDLLYSRVGIDYSTDENKANLESYADSVLEQQGITKDNGYSAASIASAKDRVKQGIVQSSQAQYTARQNKAFETPTQRRANQIAFQQAKQQQAIFDYTYETDANGRIVRQRPQYIADKNALKNNNLQPIEIEGHKYLRNGSKLYLLNPTTGLPEEIKSPSSGTKAPIKVNLGDAVAIDLGGTHNSTTIEKKSGEYQLPDDAMQLTYNDLSDEEKQLAAPKIGNADPSNYDFYVIPSSFLGLSGNQLLVIPRGSTGAIAGSYTPISGGAGTALVTPNYGMPGAAGTPPIYVGGNAGSGYTGGL